MDVGQYNDAIKNLNGRLSLEFGDQLVSFIDKYYGKTAAGEKFKMHLEQLRFNLELYNMRLQFQMLKLNGHLTLEQIALVQELLGEVEKGPPKLPGSELPEPPGDTGGGGGDTGVDAAEERRKELERLREAIRKQIEAWKDTGLTSLEKTLKDINTTFSDLKAQWIKAGGKLNELIDLEKAMVIARENAIKQAFSGVKTLFETIRDRDLVNDPLKGMNYNRGAFKKSLSDFRGGKLDPEGLLKSAQDYYNSVNSIYGNGVGGEALLKQMEKELKSVLLSAGYDMKELSRMSDPVSLQREGNDINRKMLLELQLMNGTISRAEYDKLIRDQYFMKSNSDKDKITKLENDKLRKEITALRTDMKSVLVQTRDAIVNTHLEANGTRKQTTEEIKKLGQKSGKISNERFGGV
jgi:hypothetical protein